MFRHSSKHSSRGSKGSDKEGHGVASEDEDKTSPARAVSIAQNLGRFCWVCTGTNIHDCFCCCIWSGVWSSEKSHVTYIECIFLHLKCTMSSYSQQWQIQIFKLVGWGEDRGAHLGPERRGGWPWKYFSHPAGLIIIVLVWCENKVWTPPLDLLIPSVLVWLEISICFFAYLVIFQFVSFNVHCDTLTGCFNPRWSWSGSHTIINISEY